MRPLGLCGFSARAAHSTAELRATNSLRGIQLRAACATHLPIEPPAFGPQAPQHRAACHPLRQLRAPTPSRALTHVPPTCLAAGCYSTAAPHPTPSRDARAAYATAGPQLRAACHRFNCRTPARGRVSPIQPGTFPFASEQRAPTHYCLGKKNFQHKSYTQSWPGDGLFST